MSDKKDWLDAIAREDRKDLRDEKTPKALKKTVWALVSIDIEIDLEAEIDDKDANSDEALMEAIAEELVAYGFTIDDMGMIDPTDLDKFYPEEIK
jgi:hypothetical protein